MKMQMTMLCDNKQIKDFRHLPTLLLIIFSLLSTFGSTTASFAAMQAADEKSENLSPWLDRWTGKRIGFHKDEVNPILAKYADQILPPSDGETCSAPTSIFVPLCGKTIDMAYLAKQSSVKEVVGIDGIRKALEEFAQEQPELEVSPAEKVGKYERLVGKKITLLKGDFFEFDEVAAGGRFGAIFDRASLVAIQPSLRKDYVNVMRNVIAPGGKILLVTIERKGSNEEDVNKGPPFSLSEQVVRDLYGGEDWVESISLLEQEDTFVKEPEQKARYEGLDSLMELTFLIQAKA